MKTPAISTDTAIKLGLIVGAAWVLYSLSNKAGQAIKTTFDAVGNVLGDAVDIADTAVAAPVLALGDAMGVPRTEKSECQKCIEEFRAAPWYQQAYLGFKVSANCSAGDYLRFVGTGKGPQDP